MPLPFTSVGPSDGEVQSLNPQHSVTLSTRHAASVQEEDAAVQRKPFIDIHGNIGPIVYGGLDGIITTFAVLAGGAGGDLGKQAIIILGISSVVADALSMGIGEALSAKSESEQKASKWRRHYNREIRSFPDAQLLEDVEVKDVEDYEPNDPMNKYLTDLTLSQSDTSKMLDILKRTPEAYVKMKLTNADGLEAPDDEDNSYWCSGVYTFSSFVIWGLVPLLSFFILDFATNLSQRLQFLFSSLITLIALFVLGILKSFVTKQNWLKSGGEVLGLGGFCAVTAYGFGALVEVIIK